MEAPLSFQKRRRHGERPFWVRLGLWGLNSRNSVEAFLVFCLLLTIGLMCFRRWPFALGTLLAAAWYWLVMRWVDDHENWE